MSGTAIDVESIMEEIRAGIRARQQATSTQPGCTVNSQTPTLQEVEHQGDLDFHLQKALGSASAIKVPLSMVERKGLLDRSVLNRLRLAMHKLILYYADLQASRQIVFNRAIVDTAAALVAEVHEQQNRIEKLEHEVQTLQRHLDVHEPAS